MALNKQKGNMYPWITHTWNPVRGTCEHDCSYCYMKRMPNLGDMRLDEKALGDQLGFDGKSIFVGSSTDMFSKSVPVEWIEDVLEKCCTFWVNDYTFQTKNPSRFLELTDKIPPRCTLGVTIESDIDYGISLAPSPKTRAHDLAMTKGFANADRFVSIEPVMDFTHGFVDILNDISPTFVSIGADSGRNGLKEPKEEQVLDLIDRLYCFTEVRIKDNLKRICPSIGRG